MSVHVVTRENSDLYSAELHKIFELRHKIFVEKMGWEDIRQPDGLERDQFDNDDAVYLLLIENGQLIGGHRMLSTIKPHLFSDIFPELCDIRGVFRSPKAYELTRTCVDEDLVGARGAVRARLQLMTAVMEFCVSAGLEHFTVLGRMEIMQKYIRLGWHLKPLGVPVKIDGAMQVAMRVKTDEPSLDMMRKSCRIREPLLEYIGGSVGLNGLAGVLQNNISDKGPFIRRGPALPETAVEDFMRDGVVCLREILDLSLVRTLAGALNDVTTHSAQSIAAYDMTTLRQQIYSGDGTVQTDGSASQHDIGGIAQFIRASGKSALLDETSSSSRGHFRLDTSTWKRHQAIRELALDSILPIVAGKLMRSTKVNYYDDQVFVKEPQTAERTALHQDYPYFHLKGWQGCVMWICVDQATTKSGVPIYLAGSHLWEKEFAPNVFLSHTKLPGSTGEPLDEVENNLGKYDVRTFDVLPGDVIIHHFRTVHGAGGNRTNKPRRALSLRYTGDDMCYFGRQGAPVSPYKEHMLKNGEPLDSKDFPVVWPRPYPDFKLSPLYSSSSA